MSTQVPDRYIEKLNITNLLGNGGFDIWQRGGGAWTVNGNVTADLWKMEHNATMSVSRESTEVLNGLYSIKVVFTLGGGTFGQLESAPVAKWTSVHTWPNNPGKTFSLSAWVKTSASNAVKIRIKFSGATTPFVDSSYHTGGGGWELLTVTGTQEDDSTMLGACIWFDNSATAYIDSAMLVIGEEPSDYVPLDETEDWERCFRYYWRTTRFIQSGYLSAGGTSIHAYYPFPVKMAGTPTISVSGGTTTNCGAYGGDVSYTNDRGFCFYTQATGAGYHNFLISGAHTGYVDATVTF
jgi:hypothetical protein